jgi:fucose permease
MGVGRLLAASAAATAGSAVAYAIAPAWGVVVVASIVAGLGAGAIDAGINAFAAVRFSPRLTTWLHASYGVGAALGPLLTGAVLGAGRSWRIAYAVIGLALAAMAVAFAATASRWTSPEPSVPGHAASAPITETLQQTSVWLNVSLFFLYAGLEVGVGQWAYSWMVEGRSIAPGVAAAWVAAYWASLTVGRALLGGLTTRLPVRTLLRASLGVIPLGVLVLWCAIGPGGGALGLIVLGLALAPVFPLLISATPGRVGRAHAIHAIGFQVGAFHLGTAALPGLAGVLARHAGLEVLGPFLLTTALALGLLYWLGTTRFETAEAP